MAKSQHGSGVSACIAACTLPAQYTHIHMCVFIYINSDLTYTALHNIIYILTHIMLYIVLFITRVYRVIHNTYTSVPSVPVLRLEYGLHAWQVLCRAYGECFLYDGQLFTAAIGQVMTERANTDYLLQLLRWVLPYRQQAQTLHRLMPCFFILLEFLVSG